MKIEIKMQLRLWPYFTRWVDLSDGTGDSVNSVSQLQQTTQVADLVYLSQQ